MALTVWMFPSQCCASAGARKYNRHATLKLHPGDPEAPAHVDELADRGFLGLKIHPDYQGVMIDDVRYMNIIE